VRLPAGAGGDARAKCDTLARTVRIPGPDRGERAALRGRARCRRGGGTRQCARNDFRPIPKSGRRRSRAGRYPGERVARAEEALFDSIIYVRHGRWHARCVTPCMDIPRPDRKRKKRIRQALFTGVGVVLLAALTVGVSRLEPAAPRVDGASLWFGDVKRGEMLRQVRGPGVLAPREIRWIAAQTDGRVERILVRPGTAVEPDTVLVELSNPDLLRQAEEARYQLEAAKAELAEMELRLKSQELDQRSQLAVAQTEYESARLQTEANKQLVDEG